MYKSAMFRCKVDNINCLDDASLAALMNKIAAAIATVTPEVTIDPSITFEKIQPEVTETIFGKAAADGFAAVKRASGKVEYLRLINGESHHISEEDYNKIHSTPEMQAQLASARKAAGVEG